MNEALYFSLAKVRENRPEITEANFIVGEYGMHRSRWGETNIGNFVNEIFGVFEAPDSFKPSQPGPLDNKSWSN